ncbi:hypothetical protein [Winogradskyella sp.]|uniref:hypothetical protein n=1 Tax=Winogradskyella sp. TaxID=1883156 RepID=UPI002639EF08|nr:hypothetical protein [Winogradskyella sp.]
MPSLLRIKFSDQIKANAFKGGKTLEASMKNFNRLLKKPNWDWAVVHHNGEKVHYFHSSKGAAPLTKEEFAACYTSIYVVFTYEAKKRKGSDKGESHYGVQVQDIPNYLTDEVEKIIVYQNGKVIDTITQAKMSAG